MNPSEKYSAACEENPKLQIIKTLVVLHHFVVVALLPVQLILERGGAKLHPFLIFPMVRPSSLLFPALAPCDDLLDQTPPVRLHPHLGPVALPLPRVAVVVHHHRDRAQANVGVERDLVPTVRGAELGGLGDGGPGDARAVDELRGEVVGDLRDAAPGLAGEGEQLLLDGLVVEEPAAVLAVVGRLHLEVGPVVDDDAELARLVALGLEDLVGEAGVEDVLDGDVDDAAPGTWALAVLAAHRLALELLLAQDGGEDGLVRPDVELVDG